MITIAKAEKVKLTAGRIADFQCPKGKTRTYLWCGEVKGLGIIATAAGAKAYIFQAKVMSKSMRLTIGDVGVWSIAQAQAEARRLQTVIDTGNDPRQVKAEQEAAKEAKAAALAQKQVSESVTVGEAWRAYIEERSAAMRAGKPEWGERHKAHHAYFVRAGGKERTRGRRQGDPKLTRRGSLVPLLAMRLADLDAAAIAAWLEKEVNQAPTAAAHAFRVLRAFLTWCAKHKTYSAAAHADACQSDAVKRKVPLPKTKKDDSNNPELGYFKELFWKEFQTALDELPTNQREVFLLNEMEDMTLQQIADQQGENLKTIISRKGYAVKHLRNKLNYLYKELID